MSFRKRKCGIKAFDFTIPTFVRARIRIIFGQHKSGISLLIDNISYSGLKIFSISFCYTIVTYVTFISIIASTLIVK